MTRHGTATRKRSSRRHTCAHKWDAGQHLPNGRWQYGCARCGRTVTVKKRKRQSPNVHRSGMVTVKQMTRCGTCDGWLELCGHVPP